MPPRLRKRAAMRVVSKAENWTPRSGAFLLTLAAYTTHLELDDSAPYADCDGLGAIARSELFHDVLDVPLDRLF